MKTILFAAMLTTTLLLSGLVPAITAQSDDPAWTTIPAGERNAGLQRADGHGLFAPFSHDANGNVSGRFVSFHFDKDTGVLSNYTVRRQLTSLTFFSSIEPTPFTAGATPYLAGSQFRLPNDGLTIRVHNNPTALGGWQSHQDTTIVFHLASGASALPGPLGQAVKITQGSGHGHLVTNGNASLIVDNEAHTITVQLTAGETVLFLAHPTAGPAEKILHNIILPLFAARKLAVFANIVDGGGQAILDNLELDATIHVTKIGKGGLTIQADGNSSTPKILIFVVDSDTLDGTRADKIRAKLNNATLDSTTNPEDVNDTTTTPRVHILRGESLSLIIVKIPHFSTQTLELSQEGTGSSSGGENPTTGGSKGSPGLDVFGLLAALVVVLVVVRRRLSN